MGDVLLLDGLRLETGLQHGRGQRGHRAVGQRPDDLCRVVWRQLQSTRIDLGGELGRLLTRPWVPNAGVGHVFESSNAGVTWTDVSGNLPDAPADDLVVTVIFKDVAAT